MAALIFKPGTPEERHYHLSPGMNDIGRDKDNAVRIDSADISRHHARIALMPDGIRLEDLGSSNHCFVNGQQVSSADLHDGDEVQFSSLCFRFDASQSPAAIASDPLEREALQKILDEHGGQRIEPPGKGCLERSDNHPFGDAEHFVGHHPSNIQAAFDGVTPERHEELRRLVAASESRGADDASRSLIHVSEPPGPERELAKLRLLISIGARLAKAHGRVGRAGPAGSGEVKQRMGLALDLVLEHIDVDRAAIVAIGAERREMLELARRARDGVPIEPNFFDYAIVVASMVKGGPLLNSDTGVDTISANSRSLHSALCVPLPGQDAGLYVDNLSLPAVYSEEDVAFLCQLAEQLGPALENARLIDRLHLLEIGSTDGR